MKKIILSLIILIGCAGLMAQSVDGFRSFVADTTTNSETEYLVISSPNAITKDYSVFISVVGVNESGTATVTAMPQFSTDNTVWFDIEASADTVNNAGTVASKVYTYPYAYGRYYRVKLVSTGTGVTSFSGKLGIKRK